MGIGFKVVVKFTNDLRIVAYRGKGVAGGIKFLFGASDQNHDPLVGGGNIEPEAEVREIRDCCFFGFAFPFVVVGDFSKGCHKVASENLVGPAAAPRELLVPVRRKEAKGGVFKATVEVTANDFLSLFALIGVDADADKIAGGFNDFWIAELTVLRGGVAGSKDTRDAAALGSDGHEEDGLVGAPGFGQSIFQNRIPGDAGGSEFGI